MPVIRDGDTVVRDSWAIAEYLQQHYPQRPSLFGGDTGKALARLCCAWVDRTLLAAAFPLIACDAVAVQCEEDRAYFSSTIERITKLSPAALKDHQALLHLPVGQDRKPAAAAGPGPGHAGVVREPARPERRFRTRHPGSRLNDHFILQSWTYASPCIFRIGSPRRLFTSRPLLSLVITRR